MSSGNERKLAVQTLLRIQQDEVYSHVALQELFDHHAQLSQQQRNFLLRLVYGVLERRIELDYVIGLFTKGEKHFKKPVLSAILRTGVYQLLYMEKVPEAAVCNEAVKLTKQFGLLGMQGFVNAVLRAVAREKTGIAYPDREKDWKSFVSISYSLPLWMVEYFSDCWGKKATETIAKTFQQKPPLTIRCQQSRIAPVQLKKELETEGVLVRTHPYLSYAFLLQGEFRLDTLLAFRRGYFYVQDVSSMLIGELAEVKEGAYVIDLCAAPGGKAIHIADRLQGVGRVVARDVSRKKVALLKENIARMRCEVVQAEEKDATCIDEQEKGKADLVLADVPCSGLGVIGRKPELKYRVRQEDIQTLSALQRKILWAGAEYVKPGGMLVYSTCTISPAENEENIRWFLGERQDYEVAEVKQKLCQALQKAVTEEGFVQLLPGIHQCDGFFLAVLRRKEERENAKV